MKEWHTSAFSPKVNNCYGLYNDFFFKQVDEIWVHILEDYFSAWGIMDFLRAKNSLYKMVTQTIPKTETKCSHCDLILVLKALVCLSDCCYTYEKSWLYFEGWGHMLIHDALEKKGEGKQKWGLEWKSLYSHMSGVRKI